MNSTVCAHSDEIDPFEFDISEEDMAQEDVSHLIIDDDDDKDIIDVETFYLNIVSSLQIANI